jgi:hypothetical protein
MPRANPNTFCTKWLEQSNAMTDEQHAAADAETLNRKQLAWYLNADPQYAAYVARQRDRAPMAQFWNDTKPFSIFANE